MMSSSRMPEAPEGELQSQSSYVLPGSYDARYGMYATGSIRLYGHLWLFVTLPAHACSLVTGQQARPVRMPRRCCCKIFTCCR